jgi:ADP-heptose:LPS heptosyltransferase
VVEWTAPWIDPEPACVDATSVLSLISLLRNRFAEAIILGSFHQSPLPLALLLRMAGVGRIAAVCEDYPGSLLDVRHQPAGELHEVERSLDLVAALGYELPDGDDGRLRLRVDRLPDAGCPEQPFVIVHPGASVPARTWHPQEWCEAARALAADGRSVVVTGALAERRLCGAVADAAAPRGWNLAGHTDLPGLVSTIAEASAIVVGNTGPAHLAAAVGTPVVSIFPPTVPAEAWAPWRVPHVLLGDQGIGCAGCRSRVCPVPGMPCVGSVTPAMVVAAVALLTATPRRPHLAVVS